MSYQRHPTTFVVPILLGLILLSPLNGLAKDKFKVRVGFFPNITHSQALVGLSNGTFQKELGKNVDIETVPFNAGPSAIEAIFAGALDMTYIGPNPAINGYLKSDGKALRIIAGATSGGASLVVRKQSRIETVKDFNGKRLATPQLGNTQDVALRKYLNDNKLKPKEKGGTVIITPVANSDQLTLFKKGEIDGAWAPEPWATRLIYEAQGKRFLDERTLWPNGQFITTVLIVTTKFLSEHPDIVEDWLRAHVKVTQYIKSHNKTALKIVNEQLKKYTGKKLPDSVLKTSFAYMSPTYDPLAYTLEDAAYSAYKAGFLGDEEPNLKSICDLKLLNKVLENMGLKRVSLKLNP